ncbi:MAG: N-6 DNA methylase [Alphaproteobacteria bacterium GM202ARS2]|nr:N-6 DNA methylase [Alphaproteobacteria bacterium GM202ARS2]
MVNIHQLLGALGFVEQAHTFEKYYEKHDCKIVVSLAQSTINYPKQIKVYAHTTTNFSNDENFVVLECVNRLLEKGYSPDRIELEKNWALGKNNKGRLDILVKQKNNESPYLMIECKTFKSEFDKEAQIMVEKEGGQLFSYWQQDRNADYLCLYTSEVNNDGQIEYKNNIVPIDESIRNTQSVKAATERWNKQFLPNGIFEKEVNTYNIKTKPLLCKDLKQLQQEDGKRIYSQFLEILRHNVISDKGNAFNKIFNLFLCKIVDENCSENTELKFQWVEGRDSDEILIGRLNDLFKEGMKLYLKKNVTDYSADDLELRDDSKLKRIITELRLYKNQEFAFIEVYNEESFKENARVVIEMVKLLQGWKIRYSHKQQFLGEFFELLLNAGFKQESGQFFTPIPLVRFMIRSLPVAEIIQEKIRKKETDFLPNIIDYACGSGHFIIESMDAVQQVVKSLKLSDLIPTQEKKLKGYLADEFAWAGNFIYGIERDYRLAKTSKLSSFLNGDGEATVVHGSGIDAFSTDSYTGKLKAKKGEKENPVFDILVANPPYAVKSFKTTVRDGHKLFSLFDKLGDKSDEIEVLFVERMAQLIRPGGVASIVLPKSFLNNSGIYEHARRLVFENFFIRGIVILGGNAFPSTGINTVILFLKKRKKTLNLVKMKDIKDAVAENNNVVLVQTDKGGTSAEKHFLGYECSNRKGSEGIILRREKFLYSDEDVMSDEYVNSYIYKAMLEHDIPPIKSRLSDNIKVVQLKDIMDWTDEEGNEFSNAIFTDLYKLHHEENILEVMFPYMTKLESGKRPKGGVSENMEGVPSLGGAHIGENGEIEKADMRFVSSEFYKTMSSGRVQTGDILVCKDGARTGKCAYFDDEKYVCCVNEHVFLIRTDEKKVLQKFMFYFTMSTFFQRQVKKLAYNKKGQAGLNLDHFKKILFPKFSLKDQERIISEVEKNGLIRGAKAGWR